METPDIQIFAKAESCAPVHFVINILGSQLRVGWPQGSCTVLRLRAW
jgi:hypothetical protein